VDRYRRRAAAALLAVLGPGLLVAGCSDADEGDGPGGLNLDGVSLSFIQIRLDEGTPNAQLRVVNESDEDLTVTGVGLDWPGFGDFLKDYSTTIVAGRTLDLRFQLPTPTCDPTDDPVVGRLQVADGDGTAEVDDELDESGSGYVTRIWDRWCQEIRATEGVTMTYGDDWTLEGTGRRARLVGEVTLERGDEPGPIALTALRGSVLLELHLPHRPVLPPGTDTVTAPLVIVVPRCDEHALTESSQTFLFLAQFRLGDDQVSAIRQPKGPTRAAAQRLLDEACVGDGPVA
jgi:hypothetical protein